MDGKKRRRSREPRVVECGGHRYLNLMLWVYSPSMYQVPLKDKSGFSLLLRTIDD